MYSKLCSTGMCLSVDAFIFLLQVKCYLFQLSEVVSNSAATTKESTPAPESVTDTSNLDASKAGSNHGNSSAKKLKNLGLPKNLPKSCKYSETYNKLMASSDEEEVEELPVGEYITLSVVTEKESNLKFMFAHVDSPSEFWIHPASENTAVIVDGILGGLEGYAKENKMRPLTKLEGACSAKFSGDDRFYRGLILETKKDEQKTLVKVFYVDFGNSEWHPSDHVFYLPPQFLELPPQAIKCCLADIKPLPWESKQVDPQENKENEKNGKGTKQEWSEKAITAFKKMCSFDQTYLAFVMMEPTSSDSLQ